MNTQAMIDRLNQPYETPFYFLAGNGRVYTEFLGKRKFFTKDAVERMFKSVNATKNASATRAWIETNGGTLVSTSSKHGSFYYEFKGLKIRISDHCWTSQYHKSPDVNLCSYEINGHIEMIERLKNI